MMEIENMLGYTPDRRATVDWDRTKIADLNDEYLRRKRVAEEEPVAAPEAKDDVDAGSILATMG